HLGPRFRYTCGSDFRTRSERPRHRQPARLDRAGRRRARSHERIHVRHRARRKSRGRAMSRALACAIAMALLGGCSLAPTYEKPSVPVADSYKESGPWQPAAPNDSAPRGDWWSDFHDPKLDDLQAQAEKANPDLAAAAAHYAGAVAFAKEARAGLFPQVDATAYATHNRQSDTRPLRSASQPDEYKDDYIGAQLNYELDFWGRVRNSIAAGTDTAQAS